jgi:hypothetical protein
MCINLLAYSVQIESSVSKGRNESDVLSQLLAVVYMTNYCNQSGTYESKHQLKIHLHDLSTTVHADHVDGCKDTKYGRNSS